MNENERRLLCLYLRSLAEEAKLLARLWATDPEAFGADAKAIALQEGRAEAFARAAEEVEQ
jgi:hypothetical protein